MGNTRVLTHEFEYLPTTSVPEAIQLLNEHGRNATIMAGGTDVIPQLKYSVIAPALLIDISKIPDLDYIKDQEGHLKIGASAKLRRVEQFCGQNRKYACLYDALFSIGKVQVMNMGTLAGNLCTASPAADSAPALLVLGGRVKLVGREGERIVDLNDYFTGPRKTVKAHDELMTEIIVPPVKEGMGGAFTKMARVGSDISKITCAVAVERQNEHCGECKVAMGAVAPTPVRLTAIEKMLTNKTIDENVLDEAKNQIAAYIQPLTDVRSTEAYRKQIAGILFKDTFQKAWKRAGGEE
jgi:carbon-monoxide dehydrogenase medium subunit